MNPIDEIKKKVEAIQARDTKPGTKEWVVLQQVLLAINDTAEKFHYHELGYPSKHGCPVCGKGLNAKQNTEGVYLFCAHGDCPGRAVHHGVYAPCEDEALVRLKMMNELEQEEGVEVA